MSDHDSDDEDGLDRNAAEMIDRVGRSRSHIERARREGDRSVWSNLGLMGLVGWTVMFPTLVGAFLGRYLDGRWGTGTMLTLSLIVVGLAAGCWGAWRLIHER